MNCKPGDLAVVVRSRLGRSTGRIVEVVSPAVPGEMARGFRFVPKDETGPYWRIRGRVFLTDGTEIDEWFAQDAWLRPIRDQDGEDETLTWAGKPSDIKTPEAA